MRAARGSWLSAAHPDPTGSRLLVVRAALKDRPYIKALFWDQATLFQPPRTAAQNEAFYRALDVMGDLYASTVGTTCALALALHDARPAAEGIP